MKLMTPISPAALARPELRLRRSEIYRAFLEAQKERRFERQERTRPSSPRSLVSDP